jgi:Arc/MetJ-type ribon-helix-helix transcriptional regulator
MTYQFPPDVQKLLLDHMATGAYASEDEVLRDALQVLGEFVHSPEEIDEEFRQTVEAVREGVADAEAGRMRLLSDLTDEWNNRSSESK